MPSGAANSPLRSSTMGGERWCGSFAPNGASSPVATSTYGDLPVTIARTAAGTWTITVPRTYSELCAASFSVQHNAKPAAAYDIGLVGAVTQSGGSTVFTVVYREAFTAVDIAANANNRIYFDFEVQP